MYPALADRRTPEGIEPTAVVRARLSPNGQDQAILPYRAWRANDGEGNPLACACGMRGPKPYGEVPFFFVARGPVPREATMAPGMARETRSPARVETGEGPSPTGRGGVFSGILPL